MGWGGWEAGLPKLAGDRIQWVCLPIPGGHLMRMHLVGARDLVERLAASQRFQRHFRFELRTEHFPLHRSSPRDHAVLPVQSTTPKSGDHYK